MDGSHAYLNSNTTLQKDYTVHKNGGGTLGNIRFLAGANVGTFGTGGGIAAQSFAIGDMPRSTNTCFNSASHIRHLSTLIASFP